MQQRAIIDFKELEKELSIAQSSADELLKTMRENNDTHLVLLYSENLKQINILKKIMNMCTIISPF